MTNDTNNTTETKSQNTIEIRVPKIPAARLRLWTARSLTAASWLMTFGLLGTAAAFGAAGLLGWALFGSETELALGVFGGVVFGAAGTVLLIRRLDHVARKLFASPTPRSLRDNT